MRRVTFGLLSGSSLLVLLSVLDGTQGTLMLGTMMLAAKTGLMLSNLGIGGMMMMLLAASQQGHEGATGTYGKKRSVRSAASGDGSKMDGESKPDAAEILQTERMVRQIDSAFDSFTCIPKFVCGMNAQPPSKKTTLVNDYGHLLKLMFAREDDDDDEEGPPKRGKNGNVPGLREGENFDDIVNEELLEEDPSFLPFVLKDVMKKKKNGEMGDDEGGLPFYPGPPPPPPSPFFSIKNYLPKVEAGFGTKSTADSAFDSDPFFDGFRSLKDIFETGTGGEHKPIPILAIEEEPAKVMTRKERLHFIRRKSKELELATDASDKYRIAAEVGRKLKKEDDCAQVFKKCPYKWEEVTGVVSNIRKAITSHPMVTGEEPVKQKVVYLKTTSGMGGNQSMMGIGSAAANEDGATTVLHQLDNGNLMEISMKMVPMMEVKPSPVVEELGMKLKRPNGSRPGLLYPTDTRFPNRKPPVLSEADIDASALAYQEKNVNQTRKQIKKNRRPRPPGQDQLPVLKEDLITLPRPRPDGEDDEFEDAFPVMVGPGKGQTKKGKKPGKQAVKEEQDDEEIEEPEGDDDEGDDEGDDEDEDDEEEDFGEGRKASIPLAHRQAPINFSGMRPFPYVQMQRASGHERPRSIEVGNPAVDFSASNQETTLTQ